MISRNQTYAFLAGAGLGAAVAMLYATQSGAATRQNLREGLEEAGTRLANAGEFLRAQTDSFNSQAQAAIDHTRAQVQGVLDQAAGAVTATLGEASKAFAATVDQASTAIASAVGAATGHPHG